jgi:hypothetical protein
MKVVEGGFGASSTPTGKRLLEQIEESGLDKLETGVFSLCFDSGGSLHILSNAEGAGDVLLTFKKAEMALLASTYDGDE